MVVSNSADSANLKWMDINFERQCDRNTTINGMEIVEIYNFANKCFFMLISLTIFCNPIIGSKDGFSASIEFKMKHSFKIHSFKYAYTHTCWFLDRLKFK